MSDEIRLTWGKTPHDSFERWPKDGHGAPEAPAFLTTAAETDGEADMLCAMLRSYDIPTIRNYEGEGTLGRVVLGMSGNGAALYVPASLLEDAQALIAPIDEEELTKEALDR